MPTVNLPPHRRSRADLLRDILEGLVPVLLTAVIVSLILFRVDVTQRFNHTAHDIRVTACRAVKESNDDLDAFLAKTLSKNPTPESKRFVDDLADSHAETYRTCLRAIP